MPPAGAGVAAVAPPEDGRVRVVIDQIVPSVDGGRFAVQVNGRPVEMRVRLGPFLDPSGERVRA